MTKELVDAMKVARRIRTRRLELGIAQRELSRPGVTHAYISRIESGARRPSITALVKIAERLDTTALFLMTGSTTRECPVCKRKGEV